MEIVKLGPFNICASSRLGSDDVCPKCRKKEGVSSSWQNGSVHLEGGSLTMASRHHRCAPCEFDWESQIEFAANARDLSLVPLPGCGEGRSMRTWLKRGKQ